VVHAVDIRERTVAQLSVSELRTCDITSDGETETQSEQRVSRIRLQ
jgi:hypothetical protein